MSDPRSRCGLTPAALASAAVKTANARAGGKGSSRRDMGPLCPPASELRRSHPQSPGQSLAAPLSSPDRHPSSGGSRTTLLRGQSDDPPSGADRRPSSGGRPTPSSGGSRTTLQRRQSDDPPAGAVRRPFCGASSGGGGAVVVLAGRQGSFPPSSSAMLWI